MSEDQLASIIERIQRLLAMAQDGRGNENEMAVAAAKAQELLTKYNLSIANIEARDHTTGKREKVDTTERRVDVWRRELMREIARLNFCIAQGRKVWDGKKSNFVGFALIGRPSNVAASKVMFDYLCGAIDRLTAEYVNDYRQLFSKEACSMRKGMSDRLQSRLREKRAQEEEESRKAAAAASPGGNTKNALTIVLTDFVSDEADLNNDFKNGWAPGTTKANRAAAAERSKKNEAEQAAKRAELIAEGIAPAVAEYMAQGYTLTEAKKKVKEDNDPEFQAKRDAKWQRYWDAQARRDAKKYDLHAYARGKKMAESISLNQQVDEKPTVKLE